MAVGEEDTEFLDGGAGGGVMLESDAFCTELVDEVRDGSGGCTAAASLTGVASLAGFTGLGFGVSCGEIDAPLLCGRMGFSTKVGFLGITGFGFCGFTGFSTSASGVLGALSRSLAISAAKFG